MKGGDKMESKQIWMTAVVALVVSLVTALTVNVAPGLSPRAGSTAPLTVRANSCDADGVCEMNTLIATEDFRFKDDGRFNLGFTSDGHILVKKNAYITSDELSAYDHIPPDLSGNLYVEKDIIVGNDLVVWDGIGALSMAGNGTAYVCLSSLGTFFRSQTPCV